MPETIKQFQLFRFDQMAVQVKDKVEPEEADVDRYVGLEHIDPESLKIRHWGEPSDVESSKILFRSGDIIFGKRRAYQRKLAVADFDGICSAHAMVLRPKTDVVLEEFLPFFMQSDIFMDRAVKISVGGLSPTINWRDLAKEEFALPPLEEQRRIVEALVEIRKSEDKLHDAIEAITATRSRLCLDAINGSLGDTNELQKTKLGEIAVIVMGHSPPGDSYNEDGCGSPLLNGPTEFGKRHPTAQQYTTKPTRFCEFGDVLFCVRGSTTGRKNIADKEYCIGRGLAALRGIKGKCQSNFLETVLEGLEAVVFHEAKGAGSTFPSINSKRLHAQEVFLPSLETQTAIGDLYISTVDALEKLGTRRARLDEIKRRILQQRLS